MCGRYLVVTDTEYEEIRNIIHETSGKFKQSDIANGEIFPTNNIPVIYSHRGRNILSAARWGFPNFKNSGVIINARAETISEKPMFKSAFAKMRCIVPANGYYEWLTKDKSKTKYLIKVKGKQLFFMAGLYNIFNDKNGNHYAAITIITTDANPDITFIHNRMPVILNDGSINIWLDENAADIYTLQKLLIPYTDGHIDFAIA